MKNITNWIFGVLVMLTAGTAFSQGKISGTVVDAELNSPLSGVNVVVKGTSAGVATDADGKFSIKTTSSNGELVLTYIGYDKKTVKFTSASDLGVIKLATVSNQLDEVVVKTNVVDIAKDRRTPVAASTLKAAQIQERLGNQEFPELLNTTPSVYATKGGGGFGDGRINIRGFANENIAVMINGMPVNDMENGQVYWSNWAGLSDVTSAMQVQRGLGSSKLAIASVGGTINILTKSSDMKKGGTINVGVSNNNYLKTLAAYNTGMMGKWSSSVLLSRTAGNMYFDGSKFEGYNYYIAFGFKPNDKHDFQYTFTGAPQWHHQNFANPISDYLRYSGDSEPNRTYNSNWGYLNGQEFTSARNFYSKPIMSLNHDWKINSKMKLSSVFYASWGRGGGTGALGSINGKNIFQLPKSSDGLIRFDDIVSWNQGNTVADFGANNTFPAGAGVNRSNNGITMRANINSHDWYGVLSNFNHKINENLNYSVGVDGRYYYGYHPGVVTNLLGATGYLERGDLNQPAGYLVGSVYDPTPSFNPFVKAVKSSADIVNRNYDGEVKWMGVFGQIEYSKDKISTFFQGSFSNQAYQRIDNWVVDGVTSQNGKVVNRETGFKSLNGYNVKAGLNYNLNELHNVFGNVGYYERQPFFGAVYPSNRQVLNPNLTNEKVFSSELGYGFKNNNLKINFNLYRTSWKDRWQRRTTTGTNFAEIEGITQIHMGAEFDANYKVNNFLTLEGMFSYGDWKYQGNATGQEFDLNYNPTGGVSTLNLDGVRVGDAAQTTASLGAFVQATKSLKFNALWRYVDRLYSRIDVNTFVVDASGNYTNSQAANGTLLLPSYQLFDLGASYKMELSNNQSLLISSNIFNLFDTYYISEATTSRHVDSTTTQTYKGLDVRNQVFFGFGRTWNVALTYRF